jgi:predicted Zn finger-like uncharacterized protein
VKFLCDRCKTRYSIGDERVRGKILKIRCKNCANVITVREGMVADLDASQPAAPEYPVRSKKATLMAPTAINEEGEPPNEASDPVRDRGVVAGPARVAGAMGVAGPGGAAGPVGVAGPGRPGAPVRASAPALGARGLAGAAQDKAGEPGAAPARRAVPAGDVGRGQGMAGQRGAAAEASRGEPAGALGAAFASAMTRPPPALEEEWYVSLDGDQAGPFSLVEAQRWVAQKPVDAELHCWSEGFDDWLPVDKVSHFRGLRKRPAAASAPASFPRGGGGLPRPAPGATEDEPKPLFAATMASLERSAQAAPPGASPASPGTPSARATPPLGNTRPSGEGLAARSANGTRDPGARIGPLPSFPARADGRLPAPRPAGSPLGPARGSVVEDPFDLGEAVDGQTQLEDMPFADSIVETKRPSQPAVGADPGASSSDAALTVLHLPAAATLTGTGANTAATSAAAAAAPEPVDGDDDLSIGEVSRVVKLADLVRTPRNPERSGPVRRPKPTTLGGTRRTGANPILRSTASIPSVPGTLAEDALAALPEGDLGMTMAPVRTSHRRGLITLLSVAAAMVLGVVGAVILLVTTSDDSTSGDLGSVRGIDTSRPEDPITHRPIAAGPIPPALPTPPGPRPPSHVPRPNLNPAGPSHDPEPPAGNALRGDEIEDVARKHQDMTQRCYLRSQRGVDSILVGDVKKIAVTLLIDKDGNVSDIQLSEHTADNLGKCLAGSIRGWKFRPSSGGTFRFSLNFVSG